LLKPEELDLPLDISNWKSCVLEIGFGNGDYTAFHAKNSPDTLFFGIEVSRSCVLRAVKRTIKLDNVGIITGDARFLMRELFSDESFDRVQMNFPCPWPKERHLKRRVTSPDFADALASVLKINGYFELMTDDEVYAQNTRDILNSHNSLECTDYEHNPDSSFKTKYERKWLEMGRSVWRVRIKKNSAFTTERLIIKPTAVENSFLYGGKQMHVRIEDIDFKKINFEEFCSLFDKGGRVGNDVHWVFKRHFSLNSEDIHLIETVSSDAGFEQRYYLKVVFREEDNKNITLVKIDGNSSVYLTPSVRHALNDLANRIRQ
jgi:tRNA (guanine-N7-)-methyltransferase